MRFRGGIIEDLNLPPVSAVSEHATIADALDLVMESSFEVPEIVPVSNAMKIVGYLTKDCMDRANDEEVVQTHVTREGVGRACIGDSIESVYGLFEQNKVVEVWDMSGKYMLAVLTLAELNKRAK